MMNRNQLRAALLALLSAFASQASAEIFGGIDFPQGAISFADEVLRVDPFFQGGMATSDPTTANPGRTLQAPDYVSNAGGISYSLGDGGLIELAFLNNLLTNSGDNTDDLHVFEVGNVIEATLVSIRPTPGTKTLLDSISGPWDDYDLATAIQGGQPAVAGMENDGYYYIWYADGSTTSIDIDLVFPGFPTNTLQFNAVQLVDDINNFFNNNQRRGAEIDAVGAIASLEVRIPEATSVLVWSVAMVFGLGTRRSRGRRLARA